MAALLHVPYWNSIETLLFSAVRKISAIVMVVGGVFPFIPQYRDIKQSKNAEGFSTYVCLVYLVANILRIFFWFGHNFELALLLQSLVMIVTMLSMLSLCVKVQSMHTLSSKRRAFTDFDWRYFWKWNHFIDYLQAILLFIFAGGYLTYAMLDYVIYIEGIGFLAVFTEAMLGAPQFYKNFQNKSTVGMSVTMVMMWTSGDTFKTIYFIVNKAPAQFWICGILQVCLDVSILMQVWYYARYVQVVRKAAL